MLGLKLLPPLQYDWGECNLFCATENIKKLQLKNIKEECFTRSGVLVDKVSPLTWVDCEMFLEGLFLSEEMLASVFLEMCWNPVILLQIFIEQGQNWSRAFCYKCAQNSKQQHSRNEIIILQLIHFFFNPPRTPYTWVRWELEEFVGVERAECSEEHQAVLPQLLWSVWWHDLHRGFLLDLQRKRAVDPQTLWWISWSRIIAQRGDNLRHLFRCLCI